MIAKPVTCPIFVGRREELGMLNDARRALAQSRGQIVLIAGDAGIGKSRLLAQFVRAAATGRVRNVASAECLESTRRAFGPIREWVVSLLTKARAAALPPDVLRALAQLAPAAVSPAFIVDGAAVEKADLFAAIAALLRTVTDERATILTVEDLHWADPSTLEVLAFLSSRIAGTRLMIAATYRTGELAAEDPLVSAVARMSRESSVRCMTLAALGAPEIDELMAGALDGHALPPPNVIREIAKQSEGNPFFAEELLKDAIERPRPQRGAALPLSIRAGILERLGALSDDERQVVARAAVLGYRFDPRVLALTMDRDVDGVLPALRRARDLNIVLEEDAPHASFRFRHALTQQTIYGDMLAFEARRMHERILATLEQLGDENLYLDQLAHHAWVARDVSKTLSYNERAGTVALEMQGIPEARIYFERALEVASSADDEARLLERVGHVAQLQGRASDALESFEAALAVRRAQGNFDKAADLVRAIVVERNNANERNAMDLGDTFLEENADRLSVGPRDALLAAMARLASARCDFAGVERYLAGIADQAALPARARQNCLIAEMELHFYFGETDAWRRSAERLNDLVAEMPAFNAIIVLYTVAQCGMFLGENELVERAFARAERFERRWDFAALSAFGSAVRASYWLQRGRLDIARTSLERALEKTHATVARAVAAMCGPLLALALGDDDLGTRCLDQTLAVEVRQEPITPDDAASLGARAAWWAAHGRPNQAASDARRALFALQRPVPSSGSVLAIAAELLTADELAKAAGLFDRETLRRDDLAGRANVALACALREQRFGARGRVLADALEAAAAFRTLGWPLMEARALEVAGETAEALTLYERCGAIGDMRRLRPKGSPAAADPFTARERTIVGLIAEGMTNAAIAERLAISGKTVEKYVSTLFTKFAVRSRAQLAAAFARGAGAVEVERPADRDRATERAL